MWSTYEKQSKEGLSWLSTTRNTLVPSDTSVNTLKANAVPDYDTWETLANPYLRVAQALLVITAAISLTVLGTRLTTNYRNEMQGPIFDKMGWVMLGVLMGSSSVSIALSFFARSGAGSPHYESWTPGQGTRFMVSDWIRLQVDPFLLLAAVAGVMAAGFKLVTNQEARQGLIPLGKAFTWAIATSVMLAGGVNLCQSNVDTWTANILKASSSMVNDAWNTNTLAASEFFNLDGILAIILTVIIYLAGLVSRIFAYFRAGILPVLVGIAPVWAAMSWTESGRQSFGKIMGWLLAFLSYKPVAALLLAGGSAVMVSATQGDDSQAITLTLTIMVIATLPALIRLVVPAVQNQIGGGSGIMPTMFGMGAGAVVGAGGSAARAAGRGAGGILNKLSGGKSHGPDGSQRPGSGPAGGGAGRSRGFGPGGVGNSQQGSGNQNDGGPDGTTGKGPAGTMNSMGGSEGEGPSGASQTTLSPTTRTGPSPMESMTPTGPTSFDATSSSPDGASRTSTRRSRKEF
ncbi:hypothetical protein CRD60_04610 [Bifidobacterium aemilianum]|uniref:Type IV secretion system protein n=1 Tax=Bifidobacterium aemilianum TaxID=2493120 RepID=A0A366K9Q1_9BIFI|nr:hypothetical protein CRD60_04610 [Bifidobacterium aemilianum]